MIFQQLFIALGVVSLIGFFASSGKQKTISGFLLGLSLVLGVIPFSVTPPSNVQKDQKPQAAPAETGEALHKEPILPLTSSPTHLKKTGTYNVGVGNHRLCFSWLGDNSGWHGQLITIDGVEYKAGGGGGACYKLVTQNDVIVVKFIFPPQLEMDTYDLVSRERGGQGIYPFIEPTK
jgi:hypothetical protein